MRSSARGVAPSLTHLFITRDTLPSPALPSADSRR
uniref:Uncharacterized protein n=1 Tax=Arundo donax TaxID=35708 RepID=A0A0A9E8Z6_ARUDO